MADNSLIDEAVKIAAGAGGLGGGLVFVRWFIGWLTFRHDRREDRLDRRWGEYQDAQDKRIKAQDERLERQEKRLVALEEDVEACHRQRRDLEAVISRMDGFATGRGEARQAKQVAESFDSVIKDKRAGS